MTGGEQRDVDAAVLHSVRLLGRADLSRLMESAGLGSQLVRRVLKRLVGLGLVEERPPIKVNGQVREAWSLTPEGERRERDAVGRNGRGGEPRGSYETVYHEFLTVNGPFKEICTRWQLCTRSDGSVALNDHSDSAYDEQVISELHDVHATVTQLLDRVRGDVWLGRYAGRFGRAVDAIDAGDVSRLAQPLSESYHDIWMQLHEDLLSVTGRTRSGADE